MILSMTGFGEARAEADGIAYRVEIRSVNNRYFKPSFRLPEYFQRYEAEVDRHLRSRVGRGSIFYTLRLSGDAATAYQINRTALAQYVAGLREAAGTEPTARIDLASLLAIPGVCEPPEIDESTLAGQFVVVRKLTDEAIDRLLTMRRTEGQALLLDLRTQCAEIRQRLEQIGARAPGVVDDYARRLGARVQQLLNGSNIELEQDVLAREVAIYAERCDINEEIARMKSHLEQFAALCEGPEEAGRKLEFLAQELLREANTIGSKANDAEIARSVVTIKAAIDRIKEQVQNVE
jgi:uncharacterized protein (TIGR00255 family)